MTKYFTIEFWTDGSHPRKNNEIKTWDEITAMLKQIYVECDMITIRYVGDR